MQEHRRGAARSETARQAILEATVREFAERGYEHLTIEGIAAEAGVGKQTIYRWWPSKGALVAECLFEGMLLPEKFTPPDTGDIRADLVAWLETIFAFMDQSGGDALLRSLLAVATENADVGRRLNEAMGVETFLIVRLENAARSGELRPDAPVREVIEALVGALIVRILSREPNDPGVAARLVTAVLA